MEEAKENYLEVKRLSRVFEDLKESLKLGGQSGSSEGQMNFYQRELLQKQGKSS